MRCGEAIRSDYSYVSYNDTESNFRHTGVILQGLFSSSFKDSSRLLRVVRSEVRRCWLHISWDHTAEILSSLMTRLGYKALAIIPSFLHPFVPFSGSQTPVKPVVRACSSIFTLRHATSLDTPRFL